MFSTPRYRYTAGAEVLAIVAAVLALNAAHQLLYIPAATAALVGLHFLGLLSSWRGFAVLGGALIVAGGAGLLVGLTGGAPGAVTATVGIIAATSLFTSAARAFVRSSSGQEEQP